MSVNLTATPAAEVTENLSPAITNQGSPRWLFYYYAVQIVCQLALLTNTFSGARGILRTSAFGMSLAALVFTAGRRSARRHSAAALALVVIGILVLEMLHPETTGPLAGIATVAMYLAILGPLFWVPRLAIDLSLFRLLVITIWAFQSMSALVGALQVFFPGSLQPAIASVFEDSALSGLKITLANGERILRPMGLTDTPGGAAGAGTYAILLSLGLWTNEAKPWLRLLLAVSIGAGMFALYLCQIRSLVVMVGISVLVTVLVHAFRGRIRNLAGITIVVSTIAVVAFAAAVSVGGEDVTQRLFTLVESSPTEVYYTNRGIFLEHTLTELLPQYPLGAGLGRWGAVASYFGDTGSAASLIYVEIQWTGWLLDGGILLILAYSATLAVTLWSVWQIAKNPPAADSISYGSWAAMVLGYDVGTIALTFNFPVFMSGFGMDFWMLNACFLAVTAGANGSASRSTPDNLVEDSREQIG